MDIEMFIEKNPTIVTCGFMTESQRQQTVIQLIKSMYGNVYYYIKIFKMLTSHITDKNGIKMTQSKADPYVFFKLDDHGKIILIVSITVDDCNITGKNEDIEWFMDGIEKILKITRDGVTIKHLGVEYKWRKKGWKKLLKTRNE